jgi:hypothetical protein
LGFDASAVESIVTVGIRARHPAVEQTADRAGRFVQPGQAFSGTRPELQPESTVLQGLRNHSRIPKRVGTNQQTEAHVGGSSGQPG